METKGLLDVNNCILLLIFGPPQRSAINHFFGDESNLDSFEVLMTFKAKWFLISWMHLESLKAVKYFDLPSLVNHSHHLTHTTPERSLDRQLTCQFQHFELYDLIHLLARGIFIKIALMQTYLLTFPDMCFWWSFE